MTYATGTATDPVDLLSQISTFLQGEGWTLAFDSTDPLPHDIYNPPHPPASNTGAGHRSHFTKGAIAVHFHGILAQTDFGGGEQVFEQEYAGRGTGSDHGIAMNMGDSAGFVTPTQDITTGAFVPEWYGSSGAPTSVSPGYHLGVSAAWKKVTSIGYHLFHDGNDNYVFVFEAQDGVFSYVGFGASLNKAGNYPGGQYFFGSSRAGYYTNYFPSPITEPGHGLTANAPFTSHSTGFNYDNSAFVYATVDSYTGWLAVQPITTGSSPSTGWTGQAFCPATFYASQEGTRPTEAINYWFFQDRQTSQMSGVVNFLPLRLFAPRDTSGWSFIGAPDSVFYTNAMQHDAVAKSIYSRAGKEYMIFPEFAVLKVA
jgi:hypothetical protein